MNSLLKPTGEKSLFLNKKESKYGTFFSKNLTPNTGEFNYITINVGEDGDLTTLKVGDGKVVPLKPNNKNEGYNTVYDGLRIFATPLTTKHGPTVSVRVIEEGSEEEASAPKEEKAASEGNTYKGFKR